MADLTIIRGDDTTIELTYQDADGNAIDLTGATVYFTVKSAFDDDDTDADAIISKDITSHADPTNGRSDIVLTDEDTDVALSEHYIADVQIKNAAGAITTSSIFSVEVTGDVTRRIT